MPTAAALGRAGTFASQLRDACLAALAVIGEHPPSYIYPGTPPVEVAYGDEDGCTGMLAIFVPSLSRLPTNMGGGPLAAMAPVQQSPRTPVIRFTVVYATCVDVWPERAEDLPDPDKLTEAGLAHLEAGWILMNGVYHAVQNGTLFPEAHCRNWALGDLNPIAVQGNAAGWSFDVTIQVDGFDPYVD